MVGDVMTDVGIGKTAVVLQISRVVRQLGVVHAHDHGREIGFVVNRF